MMNVIAEISSQLGELNGRFSTVSIDHLNELRDEILDLLNERKISKKFYDTRLSFFQFEKPLDLPDARSVIIIAIPQKITLINFRHNGEDHLVVIPPTYIYEEVRDKCMAILLGIFNKTGNTVKRALLPFKLLSVRSGLGRYGRNNISYVEDMGSCIDCSLCIKACPTKAILPDRFLFNVERCITYFNEDEDSFPDWINSGFHNALVGCMRCQLACPENRKFVGKKETGESFSEEETEMILRNVPYDVLPDKLISKLKRLNMDGYYSVLSRNLKVIMRT
jgi:epoxyqueuosine reductase